MTNRLEGKTVLITGAAKGIGEACAKRCAKEGAHVVVTDIDQEAAHGLAERLTQNSFGMELDVREPDQWARVVREIETKLSRLDVLINNAGIAFQDDPENAPLENLRETIAVNVEGVFFGCKTVIPQMAEAGGGSIINISSIVAIQGFPSLYTYSASKGAIRSMTKSIAVYCQEKLNKIRCNSIYPSGIETPMVKSFQAAKDRRKQ